MIPTLDFVRLRELIKGRLGRVFKVNSHSLRYGCMCVIIWLVKSCNVMVFQMFTPSTGYIYKVETDFLISLTEHILYRRMLKMHASTELCVIFQTSEVHVWHSSLLPDSSLRGEVEVRSNPFGYLLVYIVSVGITFFWTLIILVDLQQILYVWSNLNWWVLSALNFFLLLKQSWRCC